MGARLVFLLSIFTIGLWGHMTTAMQISPSDDDMSDVIADDMPREDNPSADLRSIFRLEDNLYDIRNKLDQARHFYDRDESTSESEPSYRIIPKAKRISPSGFYITRGRRAQEMMTSQDGGSQGQRDADLLRLLEYYRALHEKRVSAGQYMPSEKRQPPLGFHAVRGRRSLLKMPTF